MTCESCGGKPHDVDELVPVDELLGVEESPAVPVRVVNQRDNIEPVLIGAFDGRTFAPTDRAQRVPADVRRKYLRLMALRPAAAADPDARMVIARTQAEADDLGGVHWPAGVELVLDGTDEVWYRAHSANVAGVRISFVTEQWVR